MGVITNAQIELLELFKQDLSPNDMLELRRMLVAFKSQRLYNLLDEEWNKQGWSEETMQDWAKEHHRTPYLAQNIHLDKKPK